MSQPRKDPFLPDAQQPLMECHTCASFTVHTTRDGYLTDHGSCLRNGLSNVPIRHTCAAWERRQPDTPDPSEQSE